MSSSLSRPPVVSSSHQYALFDQSHVRCPLLLITQSRRSSLSTILHLLKSLFRCRVDYCVGCRYRLLVVVQKCRGRPIMGRRKCLRQYLRLQPLQLRGSTPIQKYLELRCQEFGFGFNFTVPDPKLTISLGTVNVTMGSVSLVSYIGDLVYLMVIRCMLCLLPFRCNVLVCPCRLVRSHFVCRLH